MDPFSQLLIHYFICPSILYIDYPFVYFSVHLNGHSSIYLFIRTLLVCYMKLNHYAFLISMYMNHNRDKDMGKTCLNRFYRYYLIPYHDDRYLLDSGIYLLDIYIKKYQFLVPLVLHIVLCITLCSHVARMCTAI